MALQLTELENTVRAAIDALHGEAARTAAAVDAAVAAKVAEVAAAEVADQAKVDGLVSDLKGATPAA